VFDAAGASVKVVVLNGCYSETQAAALVGHVDCVVEWLMKLHLHVQRVITLTQRDAKSQADLLPW